MEGAQQQQRMELLPPGFRFFPTDEELITCYLARKAMDASFTSPAIRDVDLYKSEPWDLPCQLQAAAAAAGGGELQEGYFFCTRGSKYPSGVRARRATRRGYWKSTGKDKAVYSGCGGGRRLVGTRKTLVFYDGRAPRGEKTGWVMHEYALGEKSSSALLRGAQSECVICRVFMRKHNLPSDPKKVEMEETVHHQHHMEKTVLHQQHSPGHLLPVVSSDGCDGEPVAAAAPTVPTDPQQADSHSADADGDDEEDHHQHHHNQMVDELLMMNNCSGSSYAASPSWPSIHHGDPLGAHCSTMQIMQMQSGDDADYYLPELLEWDSYSDLPSADLLGGAGGAVDRRAKIPSAIDGSLHLDGLHWNFGF